MAGQTTIEEFTQAASDLADCKPHTIQYAIGDVVTGAYPGRGDVFGVIADYVDGEDDGYFRLLVRWEDGKTTREDCDEVVTMPEYVRLTGRYYDPEYTIDKVRAAHPTWDPNCCDGMCVG